MDSEHVKGKPLSKEETKYFVELIESSSIITTKATNATNNKLKNEEWIRITDHFNAKAHYPRTPQQLRMKWENLKKNARKRSALIRMNQIKTGGGPQEYIPPDDTLERVTALLGNTVCGFTVQYGGDSVAPDTITEDQNVDRNNSCVEFGGESSQNESMTRDQNQQQVLGTNVSARKQNTSRAVKKKILADSRNSRNTAIAAYYSAKKEYIDTQITNMNLHNENVKLQNLELQLKNEKLQLEIQQLKLKLEKAKNE